MKTYIQIGTNNGDDEFKQRIEGLSEKSNIILIEPHENLNEEIKKNYKKISENHNVNIINKAIVPCEYVKYVDLYYSREHKGLSSLLKRKLLTTSLKKQVEAITMDSLLNQLRITNVEELHIDAEGLDYEILASINLEKLNLKFIICEFWPYDDDDELSNYRTGPNFFEEVKKKYSEYTISETVSGGMKSILFKRE